jgi:hypothetical protein
MGKSMKPVAHERRWLVLFFPYDVHWTMRWVARRRRGWSHVALLSPTGNGQWVLFEWGMRGIFVCPIGEVRASRMMAAATEVLQYDQQASAAGSVLHALLPNTCMTLARQAMGLPARWNFFRSGWQLRCELLAAGAEVVIPARGVDERADGRQRSDQLPGHGSRGAGPRPSARARYAAVADRQRTG